MMCWAYDEDRTYHGISAHGISTGQARILVELTEFSPAEHRCPIVLRELLPTWQGLPFGWGDVGSGTGATAHAVLTDALGQEPAADLREDFGEDVLAHLTDEWRLRRGTVLRWVRGWCAERDVEILPAQVVDLPPIDRTRYGERPGHLRPGRPRRLFGRHR